MQASIQVHLQVAAMSSSSSSPAAPPTGRKVRVATWNLACAGRDEKTNPLSRRLPLICDVLRKESKNSDVWCFQEIRPTGSFTVIGVIMELLKALGESEFGFHYTADNDSSGCFHKCIMWRLSLYNCVNTIATRTKNSNNPAFSFTYTESLLVDKDSIGTLHGFVVLNCHAPPCNAGDRVAYWERVVECVSMNSRQIVAVGDMNKFEEHMPKYRSLLRESCCVDLINSIPNSIRATFLSFDGDRTAEFKKRFVSELDAIIVIHKEVVKADVSVRKEEVDPVDEKNDSHRCSDHFLCQAAIEFRYDIQLYSRAIAAFAAEAASLSGDLVCATGPPAFGTTPAVHEHGDSAGPTNETNPHGVF